METSSMEVEEMQRPCASVAHHSGQNVCGSDDCCDSKLEHTPIKLFATAAITYQIPGTSSTYYYTLACLEFGSKTPVQPRLSYPLVTSLRYTTLAINL